MSAEALTPIRIKNAFRILMMDRNVRAVLSQHLRGICAATARRRVIAAVKELGVRVPIVIRMEGTNVDEGSGC